MSEHAHEARPGEENGQAGFDALISGEHNQGEKFFLAALREMREVGREDIYFALCQGGLGQVYLCQGRFDDAETHLQNALTLYETRFPEYTYGIFSALNDLAAIRQAQGRYVQARELYQKALTLGEEILGRENPLLAHACLEGYAKLLRKSGQDAEAAAVEARVKSMLTDDAPDGRVEA